MLVTMELRHLRYFVAVAEEENVSRAALRLHVSQPTLSKQIQDLEEELGFPLLHRTAKSVRLTDAGRKFLLESREVLRRLEKALEATRAVASGQSGEIHVGYAPMPTVRFLPAALRAFQRAHPHVKVKLHDRRPEEMLADLRAGKLHLAFLVKPMRTMLRGLKFEELARDEHRLAVSPEHPLARRRSVPVKLLENEGLIAYSRAGYPEYHAHLKGIFSASRISPRIAEEHDDGVPLVTALESGPGVAILPKALELTTGSRIRLIPLSPQPPPLSIGAVFGEDGPPAAAGDLLQCARNACGQSPG